MTVSQQKLMSVLKGHVEALDERDRVDGYSSELLATLAEIVALEREHQQAAIQIQKKVSAKCEALGKFLANNGWSPE
jgi:hypothetical protein